MSPVTSTEAPRERAVGLSCLGVSKSYGGALVLQETSLQVDRGEVVAIVGENGAGKSTLLQILAGLAASDAGKVSVHGRIGYCPQEPGVFGLLTPDEHFALFGRGAGMSQEDSRLEGRALLDQLGFIGGRREPTIAQELSGGARQKLNLALALIADPDVVLLDEPYQGFDMGSFVNFWDHVTRWRAAGKAVVIVTHLLTELDRVDRVIELRIGPSGASTPVVQEPQ